MKPITGTFLDEITWDIPSQNWGPREWRREFDTMRGAGIDTVITIRASLRDMAIFPSEVLGIRDVPDLAQLFLDEAARCGMRLFFPTHESGALDPTWSNWRDDWEICQRFLPEVLRRYGGHPAFHGWYIAPETCRWTAGVQELYTRYAALMKELTPEKPVLVSPWYPSEVYAQETPAERHRRFAEDWRRIFASARGIDIVAFQDGACTARPTEQSAVFELEEYVRETHALCRELGLTQWNNVETFGRAFPIKFPPIDWRTLKRKMAIADPWVEKHITFEFSHFLSPNSTWPSARLLFERYREEILGAVDSSG